MSVTERHGRRAGDLVVSGLAFRYPGTRLAVIEDFSQTFRAGTLTAVVAPSGAGKSTLLSLLGLLLRATAGTVDVDGIGVDWRHPGRVAELRTSRFAWVLQNNACFEARTARDNVAVALLASGRGMSAARAAADDALAAVGLQGQADMPARFLSGGEQQRMTIARALLADRPVLLADEPTGNLDRANSQLVFAALRAGADRGAAVVAATHDLRSAAIADQVVDLAANAYSR